MRVTVKPSPAVRKCRHSSAATCRRALSRVSSPPAHEEGGEQTHLQWSFIQGAVVLDVSSRREAGPWGRALQAQVLARLWQADALGVGGNRCSSCGGCAPASHPAHAPLPCLSAPVADASMHRWRYGCMIRPGAWAAWAANAAASNGLENSMHPS